MARTVSTWPLGMLAAGHSACDTMELKARSTSHARALSHRSRKPSDVISPWLSSSPPAHQAPGGAVRSAAGRLPSWTGRARQPPVTATVAHGAAQRTLHELRGGAGPGFVRLQPLPELLHLALLLQLALRQVGAGRDRQGRRLPSRAHIARGQHNAGRMSLLTHAAQTLLWKWLSGQQSWPSSAHEQLEGVAAPPPLTAPRPAGSEPVAEHNWPGARGRAAAGRAGVSARAAAAQVQAPRGAQAVRSGPRRAR